MESDDTFHESTIYDNVTDVLVLFKKGKENLLLDDSVLWMFDTSTSTWTKNLNLIRKEITLADIRFLKRMKNNKTVIVNYSGRAGKTASLLKKLRDIVPVRNGFVERLGCNKLN